MNVTGLDIIQSLQRLGLAAGHKVLVHSSLSSLGYVDGGADTVIDAVLATVGRTGTMLVPTLTGSELLSPDNPPRFDPRRTPSWTGRVPEMFRHRPDAIRSLHPTHSVAAIGADALSLTQDHLDSITPCDQLSPYGRLAVCKDGYILFIGVGHESNTTLHHVEEMAGVAYHLQKAFARAEIVIDDQVIYRHILLHRYGTPRQFSVMEPMWIERGIQTQTRVGGALLRLVQARRMVQVALQCLRVNPLILCKV